MTGNRKGDAWCASFVSFVLAIAYRGHPPLPVTASCQAFYDYARAHGMVTDDPQPGDVYVILNDAGHAHHTGFVTRRLGASVEEISGNTNPDGGREGYGVFERTGARARPLGPKIVCFRLPPEPD